MSVIYSAKLINSPKVECVGFSDLSGLKSLKPTLDQTTALIETDHTISLALKAFS